MEKVGRMKLGSQGLEVSAQGLGCMSMSNGYYGPGKPEPDMIKLIHHAIHHGAKMAENLTENDIRKNLPRFQPKNLKHNKNIFEQVNEMAKRKGCTPSQLALAWVHHQGNDVCPIPGTTKIENLNNNIGALSVKLSVEDMAQLESIASTDVVKGDRYGSVSMNFAWNYTDTPPLSSWKA
ncbi:probable aldo-keto reductase 2 [Camellia sinensis]|uniref:NADP-dependent oxidoreductase domain-containing protein n=1 Tax=Camellia sinensis var. sinensis TaxID=542762 RepID=A0A4S4EDR7_CAMSN|nr:probable aldo-keto reductase 2 [Camellia sinensis]THG14489.1 hypothetical protein TEA_007803 [Camellia sinensis var. sinensis]